uniref:Uncharacterized protein n=1 Tax=Nymphaea colorata TaxID=210225 RepID=A0A5K0ZED8_9MAGN
MAVWRRASASACTRSMVYSLRFTSIIVSSIQARCASTAARAALWKTVASCSSDAGGSVGGGGGAAMPGSDTIC